MDKRKDHSTKEILTKLNTLENLLKKKDDRPLSFKEACAYLGFKPSYLYKIIHTKQIRFYKPSGKMLFFSKCELDEWVFAKSQVSAKGGVNQSEKLKENDPGNTQREGSEGNEEDEEPP